MTRARGVVLGLALALGIGPLQAHGTPDAPARPAFAEVGDAVGDAVGAGGDKGPVGWDTYRRLDRLAELPAGVETRQFSSFDRTGGNNDGFEGRYSCLRTTAEGCVIAERSGAGEVAAIWFTRDKGDQTATGDLTVELDGTTVLEAPLQDVVDGKVGAPFEYPLVANADQASGGVYIAVPMPFRQSMRITTRHNPRYYHVTYRTFADAGGVSTFDPADPASDVLAMLRGSGTGDPKPGGAAPPPVGADLTLAPGGSVELSTPRGPSVLTGLRLHLPQLEALPHTEVVDDGRAFGAGGSSEFAVAIDPANTGVRLTRRFHPVIGNQVADIYVDDVRVARWEPLPGTGVETWVWRDQSVDLPASVTAGMSRITVRNTFVSSDIDFNEFHYWVSSRVGDRWVPTDALDVGAGHSQAERDHGYAIVRQTFEGVRNNGYPTSAAESARVADSDALLSGLRLQISFDGRRTVDAPAGEFFGSGLGQYAVNALMMGIDPAGDTLSSWWPMPYRERATVRLLNTSAVTVRSGRLEVASRADSGAAAGLAPTGRLGYFHATSRRAATAVGKDHIFLQTRGRGKVVGVTHTMAGDAGREYLEGDERAYVDGARTPAVYGTGTEDFYQAGWYFNRGPFTAPVVGNPAREIAGGGCAQDCTAAYRLMLADAMPFESSIRFGIEHGPFNGHQADYGSTTYWYGREQVSSRVTDRLDVGDPRSEQAHGYGPAGGVRSLLTASYEAGQGAQAVTDDIRATTTPVRFQVAVADDNRGVVLRRRGDQAQPYQAAAVTVDGRPAGTWSQPLHNGTDRWLDDTFAIPAALTAGRRSLTIGIQPRTGAPPWTAAAYSVSSLVAARDGFEPEAEAMLELPRLVSAGTTVDAAVTVTGAAPRALTGELSVDVPLGWTVEPATRRIQLTSNGQTVSGRYPVRLGVPAGTTAGEHELRARLVLDGLPPATALRVVQVGTASELSYGDLVGRSRPAGYWRLGERSGSAVVDASGNEQDGAYRDGAVPGVAGALRADSDTAADLTRGYVEVPRGPATNLTGAFTLEAWVKPHAFGPSQGVVESYTAPAVNGYILRIDGGRVQGWTIGASAYAYVTGSTVMTAGQWHQLAVVYDGSTLAVYLDGVRDAVATTAVAPGEGAESIKLGARGDDAANRLNGHLDEVAVYGTALPPEVIATHYLTANRAG